MEKVVIFSGGLGNQMFQYAFTHILSKRHQVSIDTSLYSHIRMHNGYELYRVFGLGVQKTYNSLLHYLWIRLIIKTKLLTTTDKSSLAPQTLASSSKYYWGYWQTDRYFDEFQSEIRQLFRFPEINEVNKPFAEKINNCNSVSIHIRRGDYLNHPNYDGICTEEYYRRAIEYIRANVEYPHFFIFSNDPEWSEDYFNRMGMDYTLISCNKGDNSFIDMQLMSLCRHNIIANSSFSWWGSYLNENPSAIRIAPKLWDNSDTTENNINRVPSSYVRL